LRYNSRMKLFFILLPIFCTGVFAKDYEFKIYGTKKYRGLNKYDLKIKNNFSGVLDCQSFIHFLQVRDDKKVILDMILDPHECEMAYQKVRSANIFFPVCLEYQGLTGRVRFLENCSK